MPVFRTLCAAVLSSAVAFPLAAQEEAPLRAGS